jgi:hypothetical protein
MAHLDKNNESKTKKVQSNTPELRYAARSKVDHSRPINAIG